MSKHTPGPWRNIGIDGDARVITAHIGGKQRTIAHAYGWGGNNYTSDENRDANARLIAAGPELLEACKAALGAFENGDCIDWGILDKAIAKAEGKV